MSTLCWDSYRTLSNGPAAGVLLITTVRELSLLPHAPPPPPFGSHLIVWRQALWGRDHLFFVCGRHLMGPWLRPLGITTIQKRFVSKVQTAHSTNTTDCCGIIHAKVQSRYHVPSSTRSGRSWSRKAGTGWSWDVLLKHLSWEACDCEETENVPSRTAVVRVRRGLPLPHKPWACHTLPQFGLTCGLQVY